MIGDTEASMDSYSDSSSSSDTGDEEREKLAEATNFALPSPIGQPSIKMKQSLRLSNNTEVSWKNVINTSPAMQSFLQKKLCNLVESLIQEDSGNPCTPNFSSTSDCLDGIRLIGGGVALNPSDEFSLAASVPDVNGRLGHTSQLIGNRKRNHRRQVTSSDSEDDEIKSRLDSVAVSYDAVMQESQSPYVGFIKKKARAEIIPGEFLPGFQPGSNRQPSNSSVYTSNSNKTVTTAVVEAPLSGTLLVDGEAQVTSSKKKKKRRKNRRKKAASSDDVVDGNVASFGESA